MCGVLDTFRVDLKKLEGLVYIDNSTKSDVQMLMSQTL